MRAQMHNATTYWRVRAAVYGNVHVMNKNANTDIFTVVKQATSIALCCQRFQFYKPIISNISDNIIGPLNQGRIQELQLGGHPLLPLPSLLPFPSPSPPFFPFPSLPSPFPPLPSPSLEVGPLKCSQGVWGSAVSSPRGVRGRAPAENGFGALQSCQKAAGSNHFEYSEVRVYNRSISSAGVLTPPHNLVYGTELYQAKNIENGITMCTIQPLPSNIFAAVMTSLQQPAPSPFELRFILSQIQHKIANPYPVNWEQTLQEMFFASSKNQCNKHEFKKKKIEYYLSSY